ncbi:DEAD/DEAH box helicase [Jeotgalibaca sp. A122]|uniref:DEAD/DEAH box helicase n=1 Tax=Jeotgalibaca sp. A122 TaxID=3457322 RepID=UPI003FD41C0D
MEWDHIPMDSFLANDVPVKIAEKGLLIYESNEFVSVKATEKKNKVTLKADFEEGDTTLVVFDYSKHQLTAECSCEYYDTHITPCEHIIAVIYKYNELATEHNTGQKQKKVEPPKNPYQAAEYMMTYMADFLDADTGFRGREKLKFEYQFAIQSLDDDEECSVRIKVGTDKLYQMKDIEQTAQNLLGDYPQAFGKHFEYDPAEHYIDSRDRNMLHLLMNLKDYRYQSRNYYNFSAGNKSEIIIPNVMIKEVLKKILEMKYHVVKIHHRDPEYLVIKDPVVFDEGETLLPLQFEISEDPEQDGVYQFQSDALFDQDLQVFPYQKMMIYENDIFFLSEEDNRLFRILANATGNDRTQTVKIPKTMMREFMTSSLPTVQKRFPLKISQKVQEEFQRKPLKAKLYLDMLEGKLWIDLKFFYGEESYRPMIYNDHNALPETVLNDLQAEGKILNVIYDFEFEFTYEEDQLTLSDPDDIFRFIYDALPELGPLMEVYTTSSVEHLIYTAPTSPRLVIDMNEKSNLLQVTFDIEGINETELRKIMKDLAANKRYRRLSNGKLVNLQDKVFQQYQDTLDKLDISPSKVKSEMEMPLHRIFALDDEMLKLADLKKPVKEFLKRLDSLEEKNYPFPEALSAKLRPYQEEGYQWLKTLDEYGFGGVLADDMGLGKTIQALTYIASTIEKENEPILVICPSSVLFNWQKEAKQFIPGIEPVLITGTKEEREALIKKAKQDQTKLWITSYPVLLRDAEYYQDIHFRSVILDEAQIVKNNIAKTTKAVRQIKANTKFALSGTPLENQLGELYSIFSIVVPGLFPTQKGFKDLDIAQINRKIRPFVLRRLKKDVLTELPDKVESIEYIDLAESQKSLYLSQLRLVRNETSELLDAGTVDENRIKILAGLTRLRQICCDPRLVNPDYEGESAKLTRLMEYLDNARENGKRVVLFSQFTQMLQLIQKRLAEQNRDYFYLDGRTANIDRLKLTTRFNEGEKDLFLISLRAGGTGLNLTGGDTVILYDSWWNPAVESQATDRVHRFGQTKKVQVIRMICAGTIEERINELQGKKRELIDQVITEGKQSFSSLTKDEIMTILAE